MDVTQILSFVSDKAPWLGVVLMVIGALRLVIKPVMSIARSVVEFTPSKADDETLNKVEQSAIYKGAVYALDWLASIKLPAKK